MKKKSVQPLVRMLPVALALFAVGKSALAQVDFPPLPLTVATAVPPNLLYIHDDSNSMHGSYMPDEIHRSLMSYPSTTKVPYQFYMSSTFNKAYYNPAFRYVPPPAPPGTTIIDADGKVVTDGTLGNAKFTDAWFNGYDLANRNASGSYVSSGSYSGIYMSGDNRYCSTMTTGALDRRYNLATNYTPTDYWSSMLYNSSNCAYNEALRATTPNAMAEFLVGAPTGAASYYDCPASAWRNYPTPTATATNYTLSQCTQRFLNTDEEKQNFANWFSYYRTRNDASKAGIGRAFEQLDQSVRIGWGLINKMGAKNIDGKNVTTVMEGVRSFDRTRKAQFLDWLYKIHPAAMNRSPVFISQLTGTDRDAGGTPLRRALDAAGQYYDRSSTAYSLGPWADNPTAPGSVTTEKAAACRKSFTILMTDGYWTEGADYAATTSAANTNADNGTGSPFADSYSGTLADVAWYYWNRKLVPSTVASRVQKTIAPGTMGQTPPKYRDNADWQHMTTFTIGLAVTGSIDKDQAFKAIYDSSIRITWPNPIGNNPNKIDDLLHAGVNGHGDFFSASNPDEFVAGMASIINSVNISQKSSSGNIDTNSSDPMSIPSDPRIYRTEFSPGVWSGDLVAQDIDTRAEVWRASAMMPTPATRKIFTRTNGAGAAFQWGNLDGAQQAALKGPFGMLDGQKVLEFIRGSGANEGALPGQFRFRDRTTSTIAPLGDSPHNKPDYVKYSNTAHSTIFLGANDGMLHAFDVSTGAERFAYIPSPLISKLYKLTSDHEYFVDGSTLVTSPSQTPGAYMLVGALGRGGMGLYGLDVSDPTNFTASNVKWEVSGDNCSTLDSNAKYLGNVIGYLLYSSVGGTPSAVFGNGYNSCHGKAALGIVRIADGSLTFMKASDDAGNGLASPVLWDDAGAGTSSAYAGDLKGKFWKFNLLSTSSAPRLMFDAGDGQPITAQPVVTTVNVSGAEKLFVFFGTGRYLSTSDKSSTTPQRVYGLMDEGTSATLTLGDLQPRVFNGNVIKDLDNPAVMATKKGWYITLTEPGERIVNSPVFFRTPNGKLAMLFNSIIPPQGADPCSPKGRSREYAIDAETGGALTEALFDLNGDGRIDDRDLVNGKVPSVRDSDPSMGMEGQLTIVYGRSRSSGGVGTSMERCSMDTSACSGGSLAEKVKAGKGRLSWHEISN